jgi:SAM-dependent methyltransferase
MATRLTTSFHPIPPGPHEAAYAYDAVGRDYQRYADGTANDPFEFNSAYAFADREIWARIDGELVALRATGADRIRILDAGCGPGTWLIRTALRARDLGFTAIEGVGFDISPEMIILASQAALEVSGRDIALHFAVADIADVAQAEKKDSFDLCLCLYGVLNHLPTALHDSVAAYLARVTRRTLLVTVRTLGSLPTIYVGALEQARSFHQDNQTDRLEIDLFDGRHIGFNSHLFGAAELRRLFAAHVSVAEMVGLDIFHGRFAANPHWNPEMTKSPGFDAMLTTLEHQWAADPAFIDRAAHILLVGTRADAG